MQRPAAASPSSHPVPRRAHRLLRRRPRPREPSPLPSVLPSPLPWQHHHHHNNNSSHLHQQSPSRWKRQSPNHRSLPLHRRLHRQRPLRNTAKQRTRSHPRRRHRRPPRTLPRSGLCSRSCRPASCCTTCCSASAVGREVVFLVEVLRLVNDGLERLLVEHHGAFSASVHRVARRQARARARGKHTQRS